MNIASIPASSPAKSPRVIANPVDLHTHSTASDGSLTPTNLVEQAALAGITTLALTDHDTTAGVPEAQQAALKLGIHLITGIEISTQWNNNTLHVVGLNIDINNPLLCQGLKKSAEYRQWRGEEIGRRLEKYGITDAYQAAQRHQTGAGISRTHFAQMLVEKGHAKNVRDVFKRFLVRGKPGYVPSQWPELNTVLGWIQQAGGLAVLAHPARYPLTRTKLRRLLSDFKAMGGTGLEVISGAHSADENRTMAEHAKAMGLLASCGSDYHGPDKPWIRLGKMPPLPTSLPPVAQCL